MTGPWVIRGGEEALTGSREPSPYALLKISAVRYCVMASRLVRARLAATRAFSRNEESSRNALRSTKG